MNVTRPNSPPGPATLDPATDGIDRACALLARGELVAMSTETVYGLAARADSDAAVAAIYRAKGRPDFNPLIVHVADLAQAQLLGVFDERGLMLAAHFWPGPLTLVLPARAGNGIAAAVTAGLPTIALRSPAHRVARAVLEQLGLPLAAPSANRSLGVSPTTAAHVAASLGAACPAVLDGGPCAQGLESTIIALRSDSAGQAAGWELLRPGPVTSEALTALLGPPVTADWAQLEAGRPEAPGQMRRHYSPGKPVRLEAAAAAADEFLIGFGAVAGDVSLSASGDLAQAAARLFAALHEAAAAPSARIAVAPIPHEGMGAAINDRLRRAAA